MSRNKPNWRQLLVKSAERIEKRYDVHLLVDEVLAFEIGRMIEDSLAGMGIANPNVAKIAGQAAFWIRKLKPIATAPDSPNYFLRSNERAALMVGLAIANLYEDETGKRKKVSLPTDILNDWVTSFRYHSHSPHSCMTAFELLLHFSPYKA